MCVSNSNKYHTAGTRWSLNVWEFVSNSFMPLWGTCYQEGLIQADRYLHTSRPPSSGEAGLNLVHVHREPYKVPWSYWFDYISPNQYLLDEVILHLAAGQRIYHLCCSGHVCI